MRFGKSGSFLGSGVDDASHAKALDIMRLYAPLIEVVTVADVVAAEQRGR